MTDLQAISGRPASSKLQFLQDKLASEYQRFEYAAKFAYARHVVTGEKIPTGGAEMIKRRILKLERQIEAAR